MRVTGKKTKPAATRQEVYALAAALRDMGECKRPTLTTADGGEQGQY
jgi:hypothetical protein